MSYKYTNEKLFKKTPVPIPSNNSSKSFISRISEDAPMSDEEIESLNSPTNSPISTTTSISSKSDNSSDSDEEVSLSVSPRSPNNSPKLPKSSPLRFPLPRLPAFIVRDIFQYVLSQDLNVKGYDELLMFYNNKEENRQLFTYVLLCLKKLTGAGKSADMSFDLLAHAEPEKLFHKFSDSQQIQQYFSNALSQLNQIEDILDKEMLESLANVLGVNNGDYIQNIALKVAENKISTLIDENNIKAIINILQLPAFDAKKINKIHDKLNALIEQCDMPDSTKNSYGKMFGVLACLLLAGGCGVGSYFAVERHKKGDGDLNPFLFLAVMSAICGFGALIAAFTMCGRGVGMKINLKNSENFRLYYNKNEVNRNIKSSSSFLQKVVKQHNDFFKKDNLPEINNFEKYSEVLHKRLVKINDTVTEGLDRRHNTFAKNYRRCGMLKESSKIKNVDVRIEFGKNTQLAPNTEFFEDSALLTKN